jgi:hypothetical protein
LVVVILQILCMSRAHSCAGVKIPTQETYMSPIKITHLFRAHTCLCRGQRSHKIRLALILSIEGSDDDMQLTVLGTRRCCAPLCSQANVMLSYPVPEAEELLTNKLSTTQQSLSNRKEDLGLLREQVTVRYTNSLGALLARSSASCSPCTDVFHPRRLCKSPQPESTAWTSRRSAKRRWTPPLAAEQAKEKKSVNECFFFRYVISCARVCHEGVQYVYPAVQGS